MTQMQWQMYGKKCGWCCYYCGEALSPHQATRDHLWPKSKGGRGAANFVAACSRCNQMKGRLTLAEFNLKVKRIFLKNSNEALAFFLATDFGGKIYG